MEVAGKFMVDTGRGRSAIKHEMRRNFEAVIKLSGRGGKLGKRLAFSWLGRFKAQGSEVKVGMAYQGYHIRSAMTNCICPLQQYGVLRTDQ